ncbi:MAG: hypothetical protein CMG69_01050 [Candidatus Marinimicrobia bacterium]|nr:hypothetical protein [Candidatus Neomarinimicrobiota bacterium]
MKKHLFLIISIVFLFSCEDKQEKDCAGVEGGTAVLDNCEQCVGGDTGETACVEDCNGDFGGTAVLDNCDNCVGGTTNEIACTQDCADVWGGTATVDNCDECVGGNTGVEACTEDCNGDFGGNATIDNCDNCVGGNTGVEACTEDCNGDWGGTSWESDCGCVSVDNSGDDCDDCAGIPNGNSEILTYWYDADNDGLGAGESSEFCSGTVEAGWVLNNDDTDDNCTSNVHDCAGVCDGDAEIDCEDICNGGAVEDCAGVCNGTTQPEDCTVTDIDGNVYQNVQIGNQLWIAENLKVTHYNDGSEIPTGYSNNEWSSLSTGAYAVYGDNESNADTYGYLYNWYTVDDSRGVCPEGWHVPTDGEYSELTNYLGSNWGGKLKECTEGSCPESEYWNYHPNSGATNESGFTALPGSRRLSDGNYLHMGNFGFFWSSTENGSNSAWCRELKYQYSGIYRYTSGRESGFSVRCIRD